MTNILEIKGLTKSFGAIMAVDNVSFGLKKGELLALIGPNGAGKSTCFNMLMGQIKPTAGTILLNDHNITGMPTRVIWRMGVGRTFQITATYASCKWHFCLMDVTFFHFCLMPAKCIATRQWNY